MMILPTVRRSFLALGCAAAVFAHTASAQTSRVLVGESDLTKDPSGIPLLHLARGTSVSVGTAHNGWMQATVEGWIAEVALHEDKRDGFDLSVTPGAGTTLRSAPNGGTVLANARLGALFDKIESRNGWVHVKRTGWLSQVAFVTPVAAATPTAAPGKAPVTAPATAGAKPGVAPAVAAPVVPTVNAGSMLALVPNGPPAGTLEAPAKAEVVEHRNGWTHVKIDLWVRDAALSTAPQSGGITAADLRAAPEKYVGQTVEWTIEVLGIAKADELRPELPMGQPYVLARGPLPESGFLYIAVSKDDAELFRKMEPLAKVKVRATIKAGRSRFLPTPVLTFVRLLD